MRAIMVGPLYLTTRSIASTAVRHSASCCSALRELLDVFDGVLQRDELASRQKMEPQHIPAQYFLAETL
jgi:hypothetical protein